jgi:predicted nucleic acid-binding protein
LPGILLDTSGYSAFRRGHSGVLREIQEADGITITPVVLGELRAGFLMGRRAERNKTDLEAFLSSPRVRVADIDSGTAERYAVILVDLREAGTPIPTNDIWIAASAMQHGLRVVTTDEHYKKVRQVVVAFHAP